MNFDKKNLERTKKTYENKAWKYKGDKASNEVNLILDLIEDIEELRSKDSS